MIDIKTILRNYSEFLTASWDIIELVSKDDKAESFMIDWMQANWEFMVEGMIDNKKIVLEVYGDGADCNGASSRVLYPEDSPTHKIICVPLTSIKMYDVLNDKNLDETTSDIVFDRFVSIGDDGWYYEKPNFDYVLADYDNCQAVINFENTNFSLKKI